MKFEITITTKTLYRFMLRQAYLGVSGWVGVVIGAMMIVLYFRTDNIWALILSAVVIFYTPWSLFLRSIKQIKLSPAFKKPTQYSVDENGISAAQGEKAVLVAWEQLYKIAGSRKCIYVYTSPIYAWIIPRAELGDQAAALAEIMALYLPKAKIRGRL